MGAARFSPISAVRGLVTLFPGSPAPDCAARTPASLPLPSVVQRPVDPQEAARHIRQAADRLGVRLDRSSRPLPGPERNSHPAHRSQAATGAARAGRRATPNLVQECRTFFCTKPKHGVYFKWLLRPSNAPASRRLRFGEFCEALPQEPFCFSLLQPHPHLIVQARRAGQRGGGTRFWISVFSSCRNRCPKHLSVTTGQRDPLLAASDVAAPPVAATSPAHTPSSRSGRRYYVPALFRHKPIRPLTRRDIRGMICLTAAPPR